MKWVAGFTKVDLNSDCTALGIFFGFESYASYGKTVLKRHVMLKDSALVRIYIQIAIT